MSGGLGEREMLWEHEPRASVSTAFSSSPKPLTFISGAHVLGYIKIDLNKKKNSLWFLC